MNREEMYEEFRSKFPAISKEVDAVVIDEWIELDIAGIYIWFEFLAKVINNKMNAKEPASSFKEMFEFLRATYLKGDQGIKACIDVGVVENLFWNVSAEKSAPYWGELPEVFKGLYVNFHLQPPA